jgi:dethiobiotin synthetase/adenosylmethionine--8-amino-7-oxononanoate aminotransferase
VIFDEVFTGLHRLGRFSSSSFLGVHPDITVHAKLLTGGLLPLCTTSASESIFKQFLHKDKTMALLHGHSYTAHAVGCAVAKKSVETIGRLQEGEEWAAARKDWEEGAWSLWRRGFVEEVSSVQRVEGVWALGTVLAMQIRDGEIGGASMSPPSPQLDDGIGQG